MQTEITKETLLRPEEASKILNVTCNTLITWEQKGKIKCIRTKGGHRRFLLSSINSMLRGESEDEKSRKQRGRRVCYCRVSSRGQKEDLERQIEYFRGEYPTHEVVSDFGSGLNFKRKGFNSLLDSAVKGDIREIVVTHRDRLCRFGFELIERIVRERSNGKIVVLDQEETSPEKELVGDLISIITVFSSRLYGLRSHSLKRKIKEAAGSEKGEDEGGGKRSEDIEDEILSN